MTRAPRTSRAASRRADVAVVGGGVVGTACALALSDAGLQVTLLEHAEPTPWDAARHDPRVYAFAPDNAALFDRLGAWDAVRTARAHPYRAMHVLDAAGGAPLRFEADAFAERELGWIIENGLLQDRLWARLRDAGVQARCPARVVGLERQDDHVVLQLDDDLRVEAAVAVAADGGQSTLRTLAGIDVDAHDYGQRGLVAYVATERPHEDTAWQVFLPTGPLAFLPVDPWPESANVCSIVWTLPEAEAARMRALDDAAFGDAIARASRGLLGAVCPLTPRLAFPLRRQLARTQADGRVLVLGDAAHTVHPLAGQGVNLGLRDVAALAASVADARARRVAWDAPHRLARWARARRSDNVASAHAFEAINRVFSNDAVVPTLLRGHLLGLAGRVPSLGRALWRHAAGR